MSQNHFTLSFHLKSPADAKAVAVQLPPLMPGLFQAEQTLLFQGYAANSDRGRHRRVGRRNQILDAFGQ